MKMNKNEWDHASNEWIESLEVNGLRKKLLIPATLDLLEDINGKKVIDIGCGEGGYSRLMADMGAEVVGVDYSTELIHEAKRRTTDQSISYQVADASNLERIQGDTFDIALSAMCLMAVEDYQGAVKEAYRVLKPGGIFVFSILHPCFVVNNYHLEHAFQDSLSEHLGKPITFWHRTLSSIVNTLTDTGFVLNVMHEPTMQRPELDKQSMSSGPRFLIMRWIKQ